MRSHKYKNSLITSITNSKEGLIKMKNETFPFDKTQAMAQMEDALTNLDSPYYCGLAAGLCGGFYLGKR